MGFNSGFKGLTGLHQTFNRNIVLISNMPIVLYLNLGTMKSPDSNPQ